MQTKLHTTMTVILGLWLAMLPYAGFAVSFALPNDSTETPDTSIAKRYPYLHFVEKDHGASKDSSNLSDEEFYNRAGRMVFPVNKFNLPKKSPLLKELTNDVIPMLNRDSIQLLRVEEPRQHPVAACRVAWCRLSGRSFLEQQAFEPAAFVDTV